MAATNRRRVLLLDDQTPARAAIEKVLREGGYEVVVVSDGARAVAALSESPVDAVVTPLRMPGLSGLELVRSLRDKSAFTPIIVMTSSGATATGIQAMRAGADDYITRPVEPDALLVALERAILHRDWRLEAENLRSQVYESEDVALHGLLGASTAMQEVYRAARQAAATKAAVLIAGEPGTGKKALARAIHAMSARKDKPFVSVKCSALDARHPDNDLFGTEGRPGRFEQAKGGTLFLEEVAEIPAPMQSKLAQLLQEREGKGDDVRVIGATSRDLKAAVSAGRFREDLYYRLHVIQCEMPSLRSREADVLLLAHHFLRKLAADHRKPVEGFTEAARTKLTSYLWPGNVKELETAMERAVALCNGRLIEDSHLPFEVAPVPATNIHIPGSTMAQIEKHAILSTLDATKGSTTRAAQILDISVRTIQYRLHEYGVAGQRAKSASSATAGPSRNGVHRAGDGWDRQPTR